jgi:hypothetical protein
VNRSLIVATLAALAAVALVVVGATYAAPTRSVDVGPDRLGAGVLQLDLAGGDAAATLTFAGLMPGHRTDRLMWVATNDPRSTTEATLALTIDHLVDRPGPCRLTVSKARAEIASGIGGCTVEGESAAGTPAQGNLSRLVELDVRYAGAAPGSCAQADPAELLLPATGPGNLRTLAGASLPLKRADGTGELSLAPGTGVCLAVGLNWPPGAYSAAPDRDHPLDNAAEGDTLSVRVVFSLTQVHP